MTGCKQDMEDNGRSNEDDNAEIRWKLRSLPPAHYIFKIENFSLLSDANVECFKSADFEVGGYKWMLSVYPRGNDDKNGDGYISLYLVLSESNKLAFNQEVNVYFKLFVYDHISDNYWIVQDADEKVRRFRGIKREWGFDKLISVSDFKDDSNGYLRNDSCIFGAEILVIENANKGECLSMVKTPTNNTYTWTISEFSKLGLDYTTSKEFSIGGSKWSIRVYPKGEPKEKGKNLSIYLMREDDGNGRNVYAEFILRVRNQLEEEHGEFKGEYDFKPNHGRGWPSFMSLDDLNVKSKGFMRNNTLIVEVEIQTMTVIKELS
ncbi:uncharacterized protein LOC126661377 [Mercurialis annua]|uniref:uncharacterized protein LOC126661377 n=1 Tax=Mercurialis annua TaxID=3986 RepID=UPI0021602741|nr:uncharacterized protein LOC126661377 [Mercurialis annua]